MSSLVETPRETDVDNFQVSGARRRANVSIITAVLLTTLLGFAALGVDISRAASARRLLQEAADNCALSTTAYVANAPGYYPREQVSAMATTFGQQFMSVLPLDGELVGELNVQTGMSVYDDNPESPTFGKYPPELFEPNNSLFNSVRVQGSVSVPDVLGKIVGSDAIIISASAAAVLPGRDFVIVYDESGSMSYDSSLGHIHSMRALRLESAEYANATINLHDLWTNFPNTLDDPGFNPAEPGPTFGTFMDQQGYGFSDDYVCDPFAGHPEHPDNTYDPIDDPGLLYLPPNVSWDSGFVEHDRIIESLQAQQYSPAEIDAIVLADWDPEANPGWGSGAYLRRRVGIALGLYAWNSGIEYGKWHMENWPPVGNQDGVIANSEMTYDHVAPPYGLPLYGGWNHWIQKMGVSGVNSSGEYLDFSANYGHTGPEGQEYDNFANFYGVKTLWNHFLVNRYLRRNSITPELANTPQQPMDSVNNALATLLDQLVTMNIGDYIASVNYAKDATNPSRWVDFRSGAAYSDISNMLTSRQASHINGETNTGQALEKAIDALLNLDTQVPLDQSTAVDPRPGQVRQYILLFTDGLPTEGGPNDPDPAEYARAQAHRAALNNITVHTFTIGVNGDWSNDCPPCQGGPFPPIANPQDDDPTVDLENCGVGQVIANMTGGQAFHIFGDFDTIYQQLAGALGEAVAPPRTKPFLAN